MQNFLYKKETFIYEKKDSITTELCKDIIELFEKENVNNDYYYNIDCKPNFHKIKNHLTQQLTKNLTEYERNINKIKNYTILKSCCRNFVFYIEKNKPKNIFNYTNRNTIGSTSIKMLMYIWFLNDYDGEISFWNEYKIIPKAGKFLLFPLSWCFPYQELINLQDDKYIIYGYIYA
jgi:hypothetical protein